MPFSSILFHSYILPELTMAVSHIGMYQKIPDKKKNLLTFQKGTFLSST